MKLRALAALVCVAAAAVGSTARAQQPAPVARLANLEGRVLVSQDDAMIAAANDQRLVVGTRVVTMTGGKALIRYDNGCDVALKENQRFTVRLGECPVLLGQVESLAVPAAAVSTDTLFGVAGLVGAGYGAYEFFRNKPVSSN